MKPYSEARQEQWIREQIDAASERIKWAQATHRERYGRENRFLIRASMELTLCKDYLPSEEE